MPDVDLFLEVAGIAGVFVGFGALIAVRTGGATDTFEVAFMRGVVSVGLLTVVAALAPVTLGRYDFTAHGVWALSSVVLLVGLAAIVTMNALTPEYRADETAELGRALPRWLDVATTVLAVGILILAEVLAPIVIIVGLAPELEAALYFTAVVVTLLWAGWLLLMMVFRGRKPVAA